MARNGLDLSETRMRILKLSLMLAVYSLGANSQPLRSLKSVAVPEVPGLTDFVRDRSALVALGKLFFWDMQAGSDGRTACASCHFHAGADHRLRNQVAGVNATANYTLTPADFPFRLLSNTGNRQSAVIRDNRFIAGSAGVIERLFVEAMAGHAVENAADVAHASAFAVNGVRLRQITGRNTPSVINAVFNVRNFWDGRASQIFTGATPFGDSDQSLNVWAYRDGRLAAEALRMSNASLASQAVGPALNEVEMSWAGRKWPQMGRKLLSLPPLAGQVVMVDDSVLGALASTAGPGLRADVTYSGLIQAAFLPEFWSAKEGNGEFAQVELNFPLFWGLALQAYQATLVSDDSRVDRFFEGDTSALTALEQQGLREFQDGGSQCQQCHGGPELTAAAFTTVQRRAVNSGDPANSGFFRIGVSSIEEDLGLGGNDGFARPLFLAARAGAANGTFKAPALRNVELTGPYFHNGSQSTLEQVLEFYGRNGDIQAGGNLGPGIGQIRLSQQNRTAIVAFLKALTDDRVRYQSAPFDHPSLCVPHGAAELAPGVPAVDQAQTGVTARDNWALVPAVGRAGKSAPLQTFEEMLRGVGNDGSRANTLVNGCQP